MRGALAGLPTPHPIGESLPACYAEDSFIQRLTAALDEVLAPVFATLDCMPGYLDPQLAPLDFLDWLAGWVALDLDEGWTVEQRRELVARAVDLHRWRGTRTGLSDHVALLTGGAVEVLDSGACVWSERSGEPPAGGAAPGVVVRVRVADPGAVDQHRLRAAVIDAVPAHLPVVVEVLGA